MAFVNGGERNTQRERERARHSLKTKLSLKIVFDGMKQRKWREKEKKIRKR